MPPAALDSPAEMLLTANSVGLGQPADELGVDVGRRCEPESMHHIARRQYLYVQEPRAVDTTGQHQVPAQPSATRHEGREAHPHVQGYARFLWQNFHWSERRDHSHHPVKSRPDFRSCASEMIIQVAQRSARVHLVLIGKTAPASRALPHRCR